MLKITKVEQQKNNINRYSIYINDKFAFGVHEDILVKFGLIKGAELDEDYIEDIIKEKEQVKANNFAIKLLSYGDKSKWQIRERMLQKGYETDVINKTIEYLEKYDYINDQRFTENFIKTKSKLKKFGPERIRLELSHRGVSKSLIEETLMSTYNESDGYDRALELAIRKVESSYKKDDYNGKYRKLGAFLQRKGYSYDTVHRVLREVLKK